MSGITGGGSAVAALPRDLQTRGETMSNAYPKNVAFQTRFDAYLKKPMSERITVPKLVTELTRVYSGYRYLPEIDVSANDDYIIIVPKFRGAEQFHATLHASGGTHFSTVGALHVKGEGRSKGIAARFVPEFDSEGKFTGVSLSDVVGTTNSNPKLLNFAKKVEEVITNVFKQIDEEMRRAEAERKVAAERTYRRSKRENGAWIYTAENESGNVKEEVTGLADLQNTSGGWKLRNPRLGGAIMINPGHVVLPRQVKPRRTRRSTRRRRT